MPGFTARKDSSWTEPSVTPTLDQSPLRLLGPARVQVFLAHSLRRQEVTVPVCWGPGTPPGGAVQCRASPEDQ